MMAGCLKQLSDNFIIKSSNIIISKEKIGAGNFADVFKGILRINGKGDREVAIKIVRVGGGNVDGDCLTELNNEALIMSQHNHQGIIKFFGVSSEKIPMILMEYCPGGSLDLHLQRLKEHILNSERIRYLYEISNGMRYLERKKCVHRDLATRNILIATDGFLKICDFGLSRCPAIAAPKETGTLRIPIRWMAPETLTRNPVYSTKSDIWSFGVVIYEVFNCGQKPWPDKPVKWIATKLRKGITADLPGRMPRLMREIVAHCFAFDISRRPTFKQVNARIRLVQSLRFPTPSVRLLTLARVHGVKPLEEKEEIDPEALIIELPDQMEEKSLAINLMPKDNEMQFLLDRIITEKTRDESRETTETEPGTMDTREELDRKIWEAETDREMSRFNRSMASVRRTDPTKHERIIMPTKK